MIRALKVANRSASLAGAAAACVMLASALGPTATLGARTPTRAEDARLLPAVRANIPTAWRDKSWIRTRVSTIDSRWAAFMINPRSGYEGVVQTAYGFARRRGAGWVVADLGNSGVGCGRVPASVRTELARAVRWYNDPC